MRTPRPTGFIAWFKVVPLELFRVNKGPRILLREWATFPPQRSTIFDLFTYEGKVLPKALDRTTYQRKLFEIPPWFALYNVDFSAEWGLDAPEWEISAGLGPTSKWKGLDCLFYT